MVSRGGLEERTITTAATNRPAAASTTTLEQTADSAVVGGELGSQQPQPSSTANSESKPEAKSSSGSSEQQTNTNTDAQPTPSGAQSGDSNQQPDPGADHHDSDLDVNMDGLDDENGDTSNQDGNEWVMIDEDHGTNADDMDLPDLSAEGQSRENQASLGENTADGSGQTTNPLPQTHAQPPHDTPLDTPDSDMGGDSDNVDIDTAGDALASYGDDDDDLNLDPMEDSAFGDAFHLEDDEGIIIDSACTVPLREKELFVFCFCPVAIGRAGGLHSLVIVHLFWLR